VKVEFKFEINFFLTQYLGLSIFYLNLGSNNPALFRVQSNYLQEAGNKNLHQAFNIIW